MNKATNILGYLSVIIIIIISVATWRFCDDFVLDKQLESQGIFRYMWYLYVTWDGRFISPASFIQLAAIKYLNHDIVVSIWAVVFIINCILIFKIIRSEIVLKWNLEVADKGFITPIIILSIFYGFSTHISETVYFKTGGAYMLHTLFGLIWILNFKKFQEFLTNKLSKIFFFVFTLIVGLLSQNLVICILAFLFIDSIEHILINENKKILFNSFCIFCLIVGISITSFSPGSLTRAANSPNALDNHIVNYFSYFYQVTKVFLRASIYIFPTSIMAGILLFLNSKISTREPRLTKPQNYLWSIKWLFIGGSSIIPFIFVPNTVSYRSSLFFMIFLFIFLVITTINILSKFNISLKTQFHKYVNVLVILGFLTHLTFMLYSYKTGLEYKKYISAVDKVLLAKSHSENTVIINKKHVRNKPFIFKSGYNLCPTDDPNYWINKEWSLYYGIENICFK